MKFIFTTVDYFSGVRWYFTSVRKHRPAYKRIIPALAHGFNILRDCKPMERYLFGKKIYP